MSMVCSFTGHRKIKEEHKQALSKLLKKAVEYAYSEGCREFLTGGALGFDTLAAKEITLFRISHPDIRLKMILPCLNQNEKWDEGQRDVYEYLLSKADEIEYISEEYTDSCMRDRNYQLASRAHLLIAYVGYSHSGAAQTARMAEKRGIPVYNLYKSLEIN